MSTGKAGGENRLSKAIENALHSPLLNNNDIFNAKKVMLNIYCSNDVMMDEMNEVHDFMSRFREEVEVIWGMAIEEELNKDVKVTILATGFGVEDIPGINERREQRTKEEEDNFLIEEDKKREIISRRIKQAYGESAINLRNRAVKKQNHIYLFSSEDLDNDNVIAEVEETPTYERTKSKLNIIANLTSQNTSQINPQKGDQEQRTITF